MPLLVDNDNITSVILATEQVLPSLPSQPSSILVTVSPEGSHQYSQSELPRRTLNTCARCTTFRATTTRTCRSRRARSWWSWTSQRISGGVPRARRVVWAWSPYPTWRSYCDPRRCMPVAASHRYCRAHATPTAMASQSLRTPCCTPTLSRKHPRRCRPARPAQSSAHCPLCRTAPSWPKPSRRGCPVRTTRRPWLWRWDRWMDQELENYTVAALKTCNNILMDGEWRDRWMDRQ